MKDEIAGTLSDIDGLIAFLESSYKEDALEERDDDYGLCVGMRDVWGDFSHITPHQVDEIVFDFLNGWGRCRLSRDSYALSHKLSKLEKSVSVFRGIVLSNWRVTDGLMDKIHTLHSIEAIFDELVETKLKGRRLGPTAASKILHMAVPAFFVMWDVNIREHWGCFGNGAGYSSFMVRMSLLIDEVKAQGGKSVKKVLGEKSEAVPRLLDRYNYDRYE